MAKQMLQAHIKGKEISFGKYDDTVNLTQALDGICHDYFVKREFIEEGEDEELEYSIIPYEKIKDLTDRIDGLQSELIEELKGVRGDEKKAELLLREKDYELLKSLIIKTLLQEGDSSSKVLALI